MPPNQNNLKRTAHHTLQLNCETGVGLNGSPAYESEGLLTEDGLGILDDPNNILATSAYVATLGYDPQVMLRWSDDGGHTWSSEHWTSMGKIGEYGRRAIWRRLGMTVKLRDRIYEVSGTDPVKIDIMGAELVLTGTNS